LDCAEKWSDYIIVGDHNSKDNSVDIARSYKSVKVISHAPTSSFLSRRRDLLKHARKIPGDKIIFTLDVDEMISANWVNSADWQLILDAKPGSRFAFQWLQILPDLKQVVNLYWMPTVYVDDGAEYPSGDSIHESRHPDTGTELINLYDIQLLHYELIDPERIFSKHRYYKCYEYIEFNKRPWYVDVYYHVENPLGCIVTNVRGTEIVLESAYRYWRRVVVASSSEVYGKSEKAPLSEEDDSLLGPTAVGRWSYALSKAVDEHLAFAYYRQGLPVSVIRYFNSYGPRLDPRGYGSVVARFINQALDGRPITVFDDGLQTRCFTYVDDTVRGTLLASKLSEAEGKAFNIGSDRETSILELAQMIREAVDPEVKIEHIPYAQAYGARRFEETRRRVPDTHRARDLLGFEAEVPLEDGLRYTIDWFRQQRAGG